MYTPGVFYILKNESNTIFRKKQYHLSAYNSFAGRVRQRMNNRTRARRRQPEKRIAIARAYQKRK